MFLHLEVARVTHVWSWPRAAVMSGRGGGPEVVYGSEPRANKGRAATRNGSRAAWRPRP